MRGRRAFGSSSTPTRTAGPVGPVGMEHPAGPWRPGARGGMRADGLPEAPLGVYHLLREPVFIYLKRKPKKNQPFWGVPNFRHPYMGCCYCFTGLGTPVFWAWGERLCFFAAVRFKSPCWPFTPFWVSSCSRILSMPHAVGAPEWIRFETPKRVPSFNKSTRVPPKSCFFFSTSF